jgi:Protein of unknown function (DUF3822)
MEKSTANSYQLSIRIDSDGFSLSVFDQSDSLLSTKRINVTLHTLSLPEFLTLINSETQLNFNKARIILESDSYVIIPLALFKVEEAADFLFLEHKSAQTDSILFNKIPELGIVNIFAVPGIVHEALSQLFPNTAIEQHISYFITENIKSKSEHTVYCWTRNKRLDIIVFKDAKLHLINSFTYQTSEDFAYFVLNVYDKLELDMHKYPLILLNDREKPELREILEKYLTVNNK